MCGYWYVIKFVVVIYEGCYISIYIGFKRWQYYVMQGLMVYVYSIVILASFCKIIFGKVFGIGCYGCIGGQVIVLKIFYFGNGYLCIQVWVFFGIFYDLALVGILVDIYYWGKSLVDVGSGIFLGGDVGRSGYGF